MSKEEFINFLMNAKYSKTKETNPLTHLKNYNIETNYEDTVKYLISLNSEVKSWDLIKQDLLFCFLNLNLNPPLLKALKDKEIMSQFPNLVSWYKKIFSENKKYLKEFNSKSKECVNESKSKEGVIDCKSKECVIEKGVSKINLSNNKHNNKNNDNTPLVIIRFPPEPSGFLHIGHAKAALVNASLAEKNNGKLILRFDDTNPDKKYEDFEDQIIRDLKDLNIVDYTISHSSDYFPLIIDKARFLISIGKAYCDDTPQEEMRRERMEGIESKNRNSSSNDCLIVFEKMLKGQANGYCLRAKINMKDPNKAMRDPVIFRSTKARHYRINYDLHAFPTYDFTCPILDSIEGVTLACRSNEYRDRNKQYNWFLDNLSLENKPKIFDFSRLNFENAVLSKRKINELISEGKVSGWDDPRLSTIQGIKRAGMDMKVLREYILMQGASQKTSTISWDKVWAMNKKAIDVRAPRFMAVACDEVVEIEIKGEIDHMCCDLSKDKKDGSCNDMNVISNKDKKDGSCKDINVISKKDKKDGSCKDIGSCTESPSPSSPPTKLSFPHLCTQPLHKKTPLGDKLVIYDRLLFISQEDAALLEEGEEFTLMNWGNAIVIKKEIKQGSIKRLEISLNLQGDYRKTKNKITWVSKVGNLCLRTFEIEDDLKEVYYYAESSIKEFIKVGTHVQFERIGFFYCDKPYELNLVPFTKQKRR